MVLIYHDIYRQKLNFRSLPGFILKNDGHLKGQSFKTPKSG